MKWVAQADRDAGVRHDGLTTRVPLTRALGALKSFTYIYGYGDNWQHRVKIEYDGHTLTEGLEQTAILCNATPEVAIVDRGHKGVAVDGVKIYHPGLRRLTAALPQRRRRNASSRQNELFRTDELA